MKGKNNGDLYSIDSMYKQPTTIFRHYKQLHCMRSQILPYYEKQYAKRVVCLNTYIQIE